MTQPDPFARPTPAVGGGESYPSNFQLVGRLLIFWPIALNENVKSTLKDKDDNDVYQDVIIANTAVLDGEPLLSKVDYATRQPKEPFPFPLTAPIEFIGMSWTQKLIVQGLRSELGTGRPVMARLRYGNQGRNGFTPMKLEDPTPADVQLGIQYLQNREAIKAHWAQKFASLGMNAHQPQAPGQAGDPFASAQRNWNQTQVHGTPQPQYQQPAPVQDQPWNPYNGQQQQQQAPQPAPVPQWQPQAQFQGPPVTDWGTPAQAPDQPPATPANWNQTDPNAHPAWTPTPDGPPPGWGTGQ